MSKFFARSLLALCAGLGLLSSGWAETTLTGDHAVRLDSGTPGDTGSLTVDGDIHVGGNADFGTTGSSMAAIKLLYSENGTTYTQTVLAERALVQFLWKHNAEGTESLKMSLGTDNVLTLHNAVGDPAIVLDPDLADPSIQIYGQSVLVQGTGSQAYLTRDDSDQLYLPMGSSLGLFGGSAPDDGALVVGEGNASTATDQVLVGKYAVANANTALAVGNGTMGSPSNALSVTTDGDAHVGQDLLVARNAEVSGMTTLHGETTINANTTVNGVLRLPASGDISMGAFNDFDEDAQVFFDRMTAEGVVLDIQTRESVSRFVVSLKSGTAPVWDDIRALWIFVGGSENAAKLDLRKHASGPFDISWANSANMTFDQFGVRGDGSAYGSTNFNPIAQSLSGQDAGITFFGVTAPALFNTFPVAVADGSGPTRLFGFRTDGAGRFSYSNGNSYNATYIDIEASGAITGTSNATGGTTVYKDGSVLLEQQTVSYNGVPNRSIYILGRNNAGSPYGITTQALGLVAIHMGLDSTQVSEFHAAINQLQSDLGRQ